MDLDRAYRLCAQITRREARNFYYAFLSLPKAQRLAVYALYAFCRASDDVVDNAGSVVSKRAGLRRLRERLAAAADGQPEPGIDLALADAIDRFGVDPDDLADVLTGMEMDLDLRRVDTADALRDYCYHAASAVGLATLPILNGGVPPTNGMREAAVDLGLGMQYVNIVRDVAEDLDRDRIYLPKEEMAAFGVTAESLCGRSMTGELRALLAHQADRADDFLRRGLRLVSHLPRSGSRCPWLLAELYGRILGRVREAGYDVFRERIGLSKWEKVWILLASRWKRP